jgi:hypothetical protein
MGFFHRSPMTAIPPKRTVRTEIRTAGNHRQTDTRPAVSDNHRARCIAPLKRNARALWTSRHKVVTYERNPLRSVPQTAVQSSARGHYWPLRNQVPQMRHTHLNEASGDKPDEPFSERQ